MVRLRLVLLVMLKFLLLAAEAARLATAVVVVERVVCYQSLRLIFHLVQQQLLLEQVGQDILMARTVMQEMGLLLG
jgi:hypothetical protein